MTPYRLLPSQMPHEHRWQCVWALPHCSYWVCSECGKMASWWTAVMLDLGFR